MNSSRDYRLSSSFAKLSTQINALLHKSVFWDTQLICRDGTLFQNRLAVGLLFKQLSSSATFSFPGEVTLLLPDYLVEEVKDALENLFKPPSIILKNSQSSPLDTRIDSEIYNQIMKHENEDNDINSSESYQEESSSTNLAQSTDQVISENRDLNEVSENINSLIESDDSDYLPEIPDNSDSTINMLEQTPSDESPNRELLSYDKQEHQTIKLQTKRSLDIAENDLDRNMDTEGSSTVIKTEKDEKEVDNKFRCIACKQVIDPPRKLLQHWNLNHSSQSDMKPQIINKATMEMMGVEQLYSLVGKCSLKSCNKILGLVGKITTPESSINSQFKKHWTLHHYDIPFNQETFGLGENYEVLFVSSEFSGDNRSNSNSMKNDPKLTSISVKSESKATTVKEEQQFGSEGLECLKCNYNLITGGTITSHWNKKHKIDIQELEYQCILTKKKVKINDFYKYVGKCNYPDCGNHYCVNKGLFTLKSVMRQHYQEKHSRYPAHFNTPQHYLVEIDSQANPTLQFYVTRKKTKHKNIRRKSMWQVKHGYTTGPKSKKCIYMCTICNASLGFHKGLSPICHWRSKHPDMPPTSISVKLIATGEIHRIEQIYKHVLKCGLADCSHITTANKQSHDAKLQMARHWRDSHVAMMDQGIEINYVPLSIHNKREYMGSDDYNNFSKKMKNDKLEDPYNNNSLEQCIDKPIVMDDETYIKMYKLKDGIINLERLGSSTIENYTSVRDKDDNESLSFSSESTKIHEIYDGPFNCTICSFTCAAISGFSRHWNSVHQGRSEVASFVDEPTDTVITLFDVFKYILQCVLCNSVRCANDKFSHASDGIKKHWKSEHAQDIDSSNFMQYYTILKREEDDGKFVNPFFTDENNEIPDNPSSHQNPFFVDNDNDNDSDSGSDHNDSNETLPWSDPEDNHPQQNYQKKVVDVKYLNEDTLEKVVDIRRLNEETLECDIPASSEESIKDTYLGPFKCTICDYSMWPAIFDNYDVEDEVKRKFRFHWKMKHSRYTNIEDSTMYLKADLHNETEKEVHTKVDDKLEELDEIENNTTEYKEYSKECDSITTYSCLMENCRYKVESSKIQKYRWKNNMLNHFLENHGRQDIQTLRIKKNSTGELLRIRDIFKFLGQCDIESCHSIKGSNGATGRNDGMYELGRCFQRHYKLEHDDQNPEYTVLVYNLVHIQRNKPKKSKSRIQLQTFTPDQYSSVIKAEIKVPLYDIFGTEGFSCLRCNEVITRKEVTTHWNKVHKIDIRNLEYQCLCTGNTARIQQFYKFVGKCNFENCNKYFCVNNCEGMLRADLRHHYINRHCQNLTTFTQPLHYQIIFRK